MASSIGTGMLASSSFLLWACNDTSDPAGNVVVTTNTKSSSPLQGDLLLARSNCLACHRADETIASRTGALPAPSLQRVGARATLAWIESYLLSSPHTGETGLRMPDLLHGLALPARKQLAHELASYLSTLRGSTPAVLLNTTRPSQLLAGEALWRTIGCTACHALAPDESWLANKWSAGELAEFLVNPASVWHGGQMPVTALTNQEAQSLAAWLLRAQSRASDGSVLLTKTPGVIVDYYEGPYEGIGPGSGAVPTRTEVMDAIGIPPFARADVWGTRHHATLTIPEDGEWTFWIGSDDGSSLSIDGEMLAAIPGVHGMDWKKGVKTLAKGPHEILVTFFEGAGNATLEVHWAGPTTPREEIPPSAYSREAIDLRAPESTQPTDSDIAAGREHYTQLGCVHCHGEPGDTTALDSAAKSPPELMKLAKGKGCLAAQPPRGAAFYDFSEVERNALSELIARLASGSEKISAKESLSLHLQGLNCTGCHERHAVGQPRSEVAAMFVGTADLGEQGRVPPTLDGVGAKLRTSAIEQILDGQGRVRPYILTRMPNFGSSASDPLPKLFAQADGAAKEDKPEKIDDNLAKAGAHLAGLDGLACISCHGISGYPSLGVPAVDLSYTYARLRRDWFDQYMRNPALVYPGTRMPTFWQPGQKVHAEVLGGDPTKQINALWNYLALGSSMPLPKGMIAGGEYTLMPQDRTIVLGTFMDGLSARCFAVGFPQQVHFVYDGEHRRAAKAWRGQFMDAAGTWFGRAGLLCQPAGVDVIEFPAGDAVAILQNSTDLWPEQFGRDAGWRFLGTDRDAMGTPTFRIARGDLYIEERIAPLPAVGGAHLVREFLIRARKEIQGVTIRAWTAAEIAPLTEPGGFKVAGGPTVFVSGATGFVRSVPAADSDRAQLLVPVGFRTGSDAQYPFEARISLEFVW